MIYFCCDEKRRTAVKARPGLNGIDFLEVLDSEALPPDQRQRILFVHFLKGAGVSALKPENIRFEGGERIRGVAATGTIVDNDGAPTIQSVSDASVTEGGDLDHASRAGGCRWSARIDCNQIRVGSRGRPGVRGHRANDPQLGRSRLVAGRTTVGSWSASNPALRSRIGHCAFATSPGAEAADRRAAR